jgi:hypothetical protein
MQTAATTAMMISQRKPFFLEIFSRKEFLRSLSAVAILEAPLSAIGLCNPAGVSGSVADNQQPLSNFKECSFH